MAHNTDQQGNAPGNEASGTWVRVAQDSAGANWGAMFTPRAGSEVLIDFIDGDIDRPIFPRSACKVLQALPLVASGPLAPATIGLQSFGAHIHDDYQQAKDAGLSDEDAARADFARRALAALEPLRLLL